MGLKGLILKDPRPLLVLAEARVRLEEMGDVPHPPTDAHELVSGRHDGGRHLPGFFPRLGCLKVGPFSFVVYSVLLLRLRCTNKSTYLTAKSTCLTRCTSKRWTTTGRVSMRSKGKRGNDSLVEVLILLVTLGGIAILDDFPFLPSILSVFRINSSRLSISASSLLLFDLLALLEQRGTRVASDVVHASSLHQSFDGPEGRTQFGDYSLVLGFQHVG